MSDPLGRHTQKCNNCKGRRFVGETDTICPRCKGEGYVTEDLNEEKGGE